MTHVQPLIFGEVLFDCFPDGNEVLGGAPFNVAWHLQAFEQQPLLISRVGNDPQGEKIQRAMTKWGLLTSFLQHDPLLPTGRVRIHLKEGQHSFEILVKQAYDHIQTPAQSIPKGSSFLYHGTLALRGKTSLATLTLLKKQQKCPVFMDVNLRSPWWDRNSTLSLLADSTWAKLNEEELALLMPEHKNPEEQAEAMLTNLCLKILIVTQGEHGAMVYLDDGQRLSVVPSAPNSQVIDTVGAGDAFCAIFLLGLIRAWPLDTTLERAQEFASAMLCQRGATVGDLSFYRHFQDKWKA